MIFSFLRKMSSDTFSIGFFIRHHVAKIPVKKIRNSKLSATAVPWRVFAVPEFS